MGGACTPASEPSDSVRAMLLGVDVGGTFTDAVLLRDGALYTAKAPTTPAEESRGVLAAIGAVLAAAGTDADTVQSFAHGTTVATNALLEGHGARTALIATEGFTDLIELGRQARADLYRLCAERPAPLVGPELRFAAAERMGPDGVLRPLEHVSDLIERIGAAQPEAVAVVLLHSYAHPAHEQELGAQLRLALPDIHVSLSHEVVGTFREFERAATTEVDAALAPLLRRYLSALSAEATENGLPEPAVMQSSGGLANIAHASAHPATVVLSGPAGGAGGATVVARSSGADDVLCFDMGGTSCDVCVIDGLTVRETAQREVGGRPLALPTLDIHTVGAGGGSLAWRDAGGALRVGPQSAGAEPGPACYGRGGTDPTVTDAHLLLGYLPADVPLAGGVRLDAEAAAAAVGRLASQLGLEPLRCAEGIVRVANAEMVRALRVMTVERGIDPRRYALMPFGGAGPLHAAAIAEELGIERILCPRSSGVLSALGLVAAAPRRDAAASHGGASTSELRARLHGELGTDVDRERFVYELRYRGQGFELGVEAPADADDEELRERFEAAHERHYGYREPHGQVELVTVRASAWGAAAEVGLGGTATAGGGVARSERTQAYFGGEAVEVKLLRGGLAAGTRLEGPTICALPEATLLVAPGWHGRVGEDGTIDLNRRAG